MQSFLLERQSTCVVGSVLEGVDRSNLGYADAGPGLFHLVGECWSTTVFGRHAEQ